MPGLKHSPVTVILRGLTKGITAFDITLEPITSSSICSTTFVDTPVLVKSVLVVVIVAVLLPCHTVPFQFQPPKDWLCWDITPLQCVCQEFPTEPRAPRFFKLIFIRWRSYG